MTPAPESRKKRKRKVIPTTSRTGDPPGTFRINDGDTLYEWHHLSPMGRVAYFRKYQL